VLHSTIEGLLQIVQAAPRILYMRVFSGYFDIRFTGMPPINIIKGTSYFSLVRDRIHEIVKMDFEEARQYATVSFVESL
jgi:hypothetical protein